MLFGVGRGRSLTPPSSVVVSERGMGELTLSGLVNEV